MRHLLAPCLILLFLSTFSHAQKNEILLIGRVLDQKQTTLPGANIISAHSKRGTTTDKTGFFKIKVSSPDTLRISYIGFKTQVIHIPYFDPSTATDTVISLSITLEKSEYGLREAVIRAKKTPEIVYGFDGKISKWIYDYELQDDKIWMLIAKGSKRNIAIVNSMGDTLMDRTINFTPLSSFKDSYGTIFLLTDRSAKLVSYEKTVFKIYREITLAQFQKNVKPMIAANKLHLFFRYDKPYEGIIDFIQTSLNDTAKNSVFYSYSATAQMDFYLEENRKISLNAQIAAQERQSIAGTNAKQAQQLNTSILSERNTGSEWRDPQQILLETDFKTRRELRELNAIYTDVPRPFPLPSDFNPEVNGWFTKLLLEPKFCPFMIKNDTVFIFNHIIDSLHVFALNGQRLHSSYITYGSKKAKEQSILLDEFSGKFYYKFLSNGIAHLREIDVYTGSAVRDYVIEAFTFPEKILANNNTVYFLHKSKHEKGKRLYKMALD
ncbi:MAG: carboxypeptidase-like regulatory domain-containing protein [Bacteroidetes bacterium]|nr:carboxypeptidase-like regulatory domain-containing protein [Bacteroidota bacterium]HET6244763.1 carboxypeptidase-like regulatory domain-containing protein [Bacteroidia bacterium]